MIINLDKQRDKSDDKVGQTARQMIKLDKQQSQNVHPEPENALEIN